MKSLLKISWNVMEHLPRSPSPMPLSTDVTSWAVKGANFEIPSTSACMRQNLTWLDKTHAFMVWDGFKAQGYMLCSHNLWDCPRFHQRSSCSLIVIHINRIFVETLLKCLPITIPSPMTLSTDVARWAVKGANVEIPSTCSCMHRNLTWLDKTLGFTVFEGFKSQGYMLCSHKFEIIHIFINVHHAVSFSSFTIPIKRIVVETLMKCHVTSSNYKPITNVIIHRHCTLSNERGQRLNSFNLSLYALKFDMVR